MATNDTMKATIANMDVISLMIADSNFHKEIIEITHDAALKLVSRDLLYRHKIKGQHMVIIVN